MTQEGARPLPGAMPNRLPEGARPPADFDPNAVAKTLLRATRAGTLGTLDSNTGHPFTSLVNVGTDVDGAPVILTSRLSTHTANLERDGRTSALLAHLTDSLRTVVRPIELHAERLRRAPWPPAVAGLPGS